MDWTIWLLAFILQLLAMKLGNFCKANTSSIPAIIKKTTKNIIWNTAKEIRAPKTITAKGSKIEKAVTPAGVTLRWQASRSFCISSAFLGSAWIFSRFSEKLQAFSYQE